MSNISTAIQIQQACTDSVYNAENMMIAAEIARSTDSNRDEVINLLMKYSANLTADVASRVTHILMPKSEFDSMVSDLQEMESWDVN